MTIASVVVPRNQQTAASRGQAVKHNAIGLLDAPPELRSASRRLAGSTQRELTGRE